MAQIYKIVNDINDKIYIGATSRSLLTRFYEHKRKSHYHPTDEFHIDMGRYGVEHFRIELIEECEDAIKYDREKYWIEYYNTVNKGYNISYGGAGRTVISNDLQKQILNLYQKYKCVTDVAKEIDWICIETIAKVLKDNNIEISKSSEIAIRKCAKPILMFNKQGDFIKEFVSANEAMRWLILNNYTKMTSIPKNIESYAAHLGQVCKGSRKTAYGFIWKWKE